MKVNMDAVPHLNRGPDDGPYNQQNLFQLNRVCAGFKSYT